MHGEDLITAVIPNYNGMAYIDGCLDSLLSGTLVPRIIVVDNASADGSGERIAQRYPMVTLLRLSVNTGFCHAVNAGLMLTKTPYAFLLNNDTRVEKDCLEHLLRTMERYPRVFAVQALMLSMREPDRIDDAGDLYSALGWAFARGKGKPRGAVRSDRPARIFAACGGAALYRMEVFDGIGWFDERHYCYLEDVDIGWRAQIAGYGSRMNPGAVVYHAGSAATGSRYNAFKETMTAGNNACLLYKNMPAVQYWLNAPLWALGRLIKGRYFDRMGLGEAYRNGLLRGKVLRAGVRAQTRALRREEPWKKGTLQEEACVVLAAKSPAPETGQAGEHAVPTLDDVVPLYLGRKLPFRWSCLPRYVSVQGQLMAGCVRRLLN